MPPPNDATYPEQRSETYVESFYWPEKPSYLGVLSEMETLCLENPQYFVRLSFFGSLLGPAFYSFEAFFILHHLFFLLCFSQNEKRLSECLDTLLKETQAPETHCLLIDRGAVKSVSQVLRSYNHHLIIKALKLITMWVAPNQYVGSYLDQNQADGIWTEVVKMKRKRKLLWPCLPDLLTLFSSSGMPVVPKSVNIIQNLPKLSIRVGTISVGLAKQIMSLFAHTGSYEEKQQELVYSLTTVWDEGRGSNVQQAFDYFRRCPTGQLLPVVRRWIRFLLYPPPPGPLKPHRKFPGRRKSGCRRSAPVRKALELSIELQELANEVLRAHN